MGYGYRPSYWIAEASKLQLDAQILSSQSYEYRYHVILRK
jgi:hypothetical protein